MFAVSSGFLASVGFRKSMNKPRQPMKRKITAIMAADIAGYTRIIAEDEEETLERLAVYRQVFDDFVQRAGGRVFNTAGDGVMCEFPSAVEATRCAIDIQESLRTANRAYPPNRQMHFRIGISIGDVVEREGDLLGDGVNVAARLQALAEPGSICVARNVQEAVTNKISVPFRDMGRREVKNLPHPVHAFQIDMGGARVQGAGTTEKPPARAALPLGALALGALVLAGGAGLFLWSRAEPAQAPPAGVAQTQAPATQAVMLEETLTPAQAFEKLARSGGLVKDAANAPALYHNARVLEARGESANARRDYLAFAALGTPYLDPLLRLAALIRAQDGRAGAREVFADLARDKGPAAALVHALQFDGAERSARLAAFAQANPDYAPVQALLAIDLGEDRLNSQTIDEKRRELAALTGFLDAERQGRLVPFFLDHSVLAQWLERAQKRESEVKAFFAEGRERISAHFMRTNAGWVSAVVLPEAATALEYRVGGSGAFRATGHVAYNDPRTGKPMPNPSFELPAHQGATSIELRYHDARGQLSAVTALAFDPRTALVKTMRENLERFSNAWLAYGTGQNSHLMYLTHLISHRCAIEKVEIGFNGEAPGEVITLPPCDPANPYNVPDGARVMLSLRPGIEGASLRLTYVGGETSDIRTFPRPR